MRTGWAMAATVAAHAVLAVAPGSGTETPAPPVVSADSVAGPVAPASLPVPAPDAPADVVAAWFAGILPDERAVTELAAFEKLGSARAAGIAAAVHTRVREELIGALRDLEAVGPRELVEVSYGLGDPEPEDDDVRDFVNSIVRTEAAAFYPGAEMSPEDVLALWGSEDFRKRSSGRIVSVRTIDGLYCVETKGVGPFLDPMSSCARLEELLLPHLCSQYSQVVTNAPGDGHQRVFLKESVKTVVRLPDGLWVHYLNYSRTKGLGGLSKRIGRGKVKGAQEELFEELRRELAPTE